jgi:hypothetical protein
MKPLFFIEVTDTFGGEANYSWATRHLIRAASVRGAVNRFSRLSGMSWRAVGCDRYDSKTGATCFFIEQWDGDTDRLPRLNTDDRNAKGA